MAHDFIPRRDAAFLDWSRSFREKIVADPSQFGLTAAQAAEYSSLHDAYAAALRTATNPSTRTSPSVRAKDDARRAAERMARLLARVIHGTPGVTNAQKIDLGLTVRDTKPSSVPRPVEQPHLTAKLLHGSTVRIALRSSDSDRRGKPAGVAGAVVLTYVGDAPPSDFEKWKQTPTTNPRLTMTFPDVEPGAKVWLAAYWFNPRMERGPACKPRSIHVACPTLMLVDVEQREAA